MKPIQIAALRGNRKAVEILFPLTSKVETVPTWSIDGILESAQSENKSQQVHHFSPDHPFGCAI